MHASTPISHSKSAALSRILDSIPKGYTRYMSGTVAAAKAAALASKFHQLYGIGCTPSGRLSRKNHGQASCLLVMYWPIECPQVKWLLLATAGTCLEAESRNLRDLAESKRLAWIGYELVRRPERGTTVWTWRRPKSEMAELHALLSAQLN